MSMTVSSAAAIVSRLYSGYTTLSNGPDYLYIIHFAKKVALVISIMQLQNRIQIEAFTHAKTPSNLVTNILPINISQFQAQNYTWMIKSLLCIHKQKLKQKEIVTHCCDCSMSYVKDINNSYNASIWITTTYLIVFIKS